MEGDTIVEDISIEEISVSDFHSELLKPEYQFKLTLEDVGRYYMEDYLEEL